MRPRLKDVAWERCGDELTVVYDQRAPLVVADAGGEVEAFLGLLQEGGRDVDELAETLTAGGAVVGPDDVRSVLEVLDRHRLVEDGDRLDRHGGPTADRHSSNLAFFETFATLGSSREDLLDRARSAHVLVLGTGGLNSNTLPHLAGMGVGRLTLADRDVVEAKNFARQYLYTWDDLGRSKVQAAGRWVEDFDPGIEVVTHELDVRGTDDVGRLLDVARPDLVMSGIDSPRGVDLWVNEACVSRGVPLVRGGMGVSTAGVWSVLPGRSACRMCLEVTDRAQVAEVFVPGTDDAHTATARRLQEAKTRVNRGIGAVAGLIGAYAALEVLRILTGFERPQYAGSLLTIDLADGCSTSLRRWERRADCPTCGAAAAAGADPPHQSREPLALR